MKAHWGRGGIAPRIFGLGTRWRWVVSLANRPLYPHGKNPPYVLDRRLGGLQSQSGRSSEEKNSQPLPGLELPVIQPVAQRYTAELSPLLVTINKICKITKNCNRKRVHSQMWHTLPFVFKWSTDSFECYFASYAIYQNPGTTKDIYSSPVL